MSTILLATLFFLQTPQQTKALAKEQAAQLEAAMQTQKAGDAKGTKMSLPRSTMIIDPKSRADDYKKAFQLLKAEKSTSKVYFQLADGTQISNVIEMELMPSNTLVLFRYTTPQGIKFHVVEIEDILGIMHK